MPLVACRMDPKQLKITKLLKEVYQQTKKQIMTQQFGVGVNQTSSGGPATSYTGNVCQQVFTNPQLLSNVLKIDKELIVRF